MENSKKILKIMSIVLLALVGFSLATLIVEIAIGGFAVEEVPEGMSKGLVQGIVISVLVLSFLFLLPDLYIGYKGLVASKKPVKTRAHIVWAKVMMVLSIIALISSVADLFSSKDLWIDIITVVDVLASVAIYWVYIKHATIVSNGSASK